jgi:hypothetical protein
MNTTRPERRLRNGRRDFALTWWRRPAVAFQTARLQPTYGALGGGKPHDRNQANKDAEQPNRTAKAGAGTADTRGPSQSGASAGSAHQAGKEAALSQVSGPAQLPGSVPHLGTFTAGHPVGHVWASATPVPVSFEGEDLNTFPVRRCRYTSRPLSGFSIGTFNETQKSGSPAHFHYGRHR